MDGFEPFRQAAREGIEASGGEPLLVEDRPSLGHSSRTACLNLIASADAFVLIVGERGGWTAPSGKLVVDTGRDWAKLRVERFRRPHRALWLSVLGWAEASAELSGTRLREAELLTAPESLAEGACEMVLRW